MNQLNLTERLHRPTPDNWRRTQNKTRLNYDKTNPQRKIGNHWLQRYSETSSGNREVLRDRAGRILGPFETDTGVTRMADGKIIGRGSNQLLRLLK